MITPRTPEEMCAFLVHTLIPDLRKSGMEATADDFADCAELIARLTPNEDTSHVIRLDKIGHWGGEYQEAAQNVFEWATGGNHLSEMQEYLVDVGTAKAFIEHLDRENAENGEPDYRRKDVEALINWMEQYHERMGVHVEIACRID